ncbi:MAG TPA: zf-HC2 domain-containing protein [Blastocatellia bacterium]
MFCTDCRDLLSDYIDGLMDLGEQTKIENHVAECDGCRTVRDDLLQIVQFSRNLPLHSPSGMVWSRIKADIDASSRRGLSPKVAEWFPRATQDHPRVSTQWAMGAIAVLLTITVLAVIQHREATRTYQFTAGAGAASSRGSMGGVLPNLNDQKTQEIDEELKRLTTSVQQNSAGWNPEVRTAFDRDMVRVDQALERCRSKLTANPDDPMCRDMMETAYREKARLLDGFDGF